MRNGIGISGDPRDMMRLGIACLRVTIGVILRAVLVSDGSVVSVMITNALEQGRGMKVLKSITSTCMRKSSQT